MYELRILNGLHRGATLPLDGQALVVGASEDADIVLVDPGIETRHASVQLTETGWSLSPLDGDVRDEDSNRPQDLLGLQPGAFARVGQVWLTVVESDAPWQNPPPEPIDAIADAQTNDPNANVVSEYADGDAEHDEYDEDDEEELMSDGPLDEPGALAEAGAEGDTAEPQTGKPGKQPAGRKSGWRNARAVYVSLAAVTVLSACAAFAMSSKNEHPTEKPSLDTLGDLRTRTAANASASASASASAMAESTKPAGLTPEQLRQAFRKRLEDVGLLRRFDLDLKDRAWHMKAALDDEEAARFGRVLVEFVKLHHITFPVNAKVGSAENMLPFKIRQVISGQDAGIITSEGDRVYVGDTYRGMRLASIEGNHLRFTGKRKIDVKW
jgi:type III secretion protein D